MDEQKPRKTRERILEASRRLFNERGYAATSLAEIAADVGISQGNLTYHFPAKRDLVTGIEEETRERFRVRRAMRRSGPVADEYVAHLLFGMSLTLDVRFVFRDRAQFEDPGARTPDPEMAADFEELLALLERVEREGLFRRDLEIDLPVLARSLWIVSRYWMDHLRESEGLERITWEDQERGIQHHFAVLLPCLTAAGRRAFEAALLRASAPAERDRTGTDDPSR
ncbi:MAG: TetR family transcriptional regulator [Myxococcota bacterium]|nr:TetR family transcriptional regulator [Myxococcota bacterium]